MTKHLNEITEEYSRLTKHPEGSMRELFAISFPLMLSILSANLMLFFDRVILANYSLEAMNAAVAAGTSCMVLQYGAIGIASIAEVFVGQANGAKAYKEAARPVWQMVWFSLFLTPLFLAVAWFAGPYLLSSYHYADSGLPYFQWVLYFSPIFAIQAAVASFFIGTGKVRLVTLAAVLANVLNVFLDILLIFGYPPYVPSFGAKGAAIATGIAQLVQLLILLIPFLNSHHRRIYHTHHIRFRPALFAKCFRIGMPSALGHMIEIAAWAILARMMISVSENHMTLVAVGQSFYMLIAFAMDGLQKGVTAVSANFIGALKWDKVDESWRSAVKALFLCSIPFGFFLFLYPDPVIQEFLSKESSSKDYADLYSMLKMVGIFAWFYFIFDGLVWISAGVLTAAGDTLFVMLMNAVSAWLFALLPIYFIVVRGQASPVFTWVLINCYGLCNALCFYLRYRSGVWKKKVIG